MEVKFADVVQIIVAIIALVGVVYSTLHSKKEKKSPRPTQPNNGQGKRASFLIWASILLLVANFGVLGWRLWSNPATELKITEPVTGTSVEMSEMVKGTSRNVPAGEVIWVVIYSQVVSRYYPQNDPADMRADGGWDSPSSFGNEQDSGKKFDIIAILAGKEVQDRFTAYIKQAKDQKTSPGLERLPESAVRYDRITVLRK